MYHRDLLAGLFAAATLAACAAIVPPPGNPGSGAKSGAAGDGAFALHVGPSASILDAALETYDMKRALWLSVGDAWPDPIGTEIRVLPPAGLRPPTMSAPIYIPTTRTYRAKVRFYDPGEGYKLTVGWNTTAGKAESRSYDLPPVRPMTRDWGGLRIEFTADPSLGRASQSAVLSLRGRSAGGQPADPPAPYRFEFTDACGWLSGGTFSADPGTPGLYKATTLVGDMSNAGDYRLRIFPHSDRASYIDFAYEAE
ncbi:MAG: hypothetical protein FJZ01_01320 [Candidatus Sericytochromatia bacterium]|nr:hypothetical protein [Candidatus Tanganyikabacteria bacterium]